MLRNFIFMTEVAETNDGFGNEVTNKRRGVVC
jgi:hypothetical protein